ncbi:caspase family protein [Roseovarius sp. TE539]|uniref:caspase family protein n=1 Tax=Roseovarius sp. TE539 TaxID=2249812 RepID=UPI0015EE6380|nr:caspase family protein [Roseovarius sp. TE539]
MLSRPYSLAFAALAVMTLAEPAQAKEYGLVVGVNEYRAFEAWSPDKPAGLYDLQGAVNDAERIARAMRRSGVDLPDRRLLLDDRATKQGFLDAWASLLREAAPGDTLIVTYAGHGGQEREVSAPMDEADGKDETLMFHDFDPDRPREGRLNDDELRTLLEQAAAYNVIWVMDSCHSAGLSRSSSARNIMGQTRSGGLYDIPDEPALTEIKADAGDESGDILPHVTQILATETESKLVQETRIGGKLHGALSYYFADAVAGSADLDGDGIMTRSELAAFIEDRVFARMNQTQQPRILPRGDARPVFPAPQTAPLPVADRPFSPPKLPVHVIGAAPPGLDPGRTEKVATGALLTFEAQDGVWNVFNHTGDRITTISGGAERLVARATVLDGLDALKSTALPPVGIEAAQSVESQKVGSLVGFTFFPPDEKLRHLTLFNLASDGTLQYPLADEHKPISMNGHSLLFSVTPPTGADQLVAVFCSRPPLDLRAALRRGAGRTVSPGLLDALSDQSCQIGRIGLFTVSD